MQLTQPTQLKLYQALVDAFPDPDELDLVLGIGLGVNVADIVPAGKTRLMRIMTVIQWAGARDLLLPLVDAALQVNATNHLLQQIRPAIASEVAAAVGEAAGGGAAPGDTTARQILYAALVDLDFDAQVRLVHQATRAHGAAAFLVHGPTNYYGQRLLSWRLSNLHRWRNGRHVALDVGGNGVEQTPRGLWRAVGDEFGVPRASAGQVDPAAVIDAVARAWRTQHVVFVLRNVESLLTEPPRPYLLAWLEEFWQQMVARTPPPPPAAPGEAPEQYWLLLILVDTSGRVARSGVPLAAAPDDTRYPTLPLCLPAAERFTADALGDWLDRQTTQQAMRVVLDAQALLDSSDNGVPQLVYEEICRRHQVNFQGALPTWLT